MATAANILKANLQSITSLTLAAGIMQDSDPKLAQACLEKAERIKEQILAAK